MSHAFLLDRSGHCRVRLDESGLSFYSSVVLNSEKVTVCLRRAFAMRARRIGRIGVEASLWLCW